LEPEKAQFIVMTVAFLHNFLRRSPDWSAIYTVSGTFDYEENVRVIAGSWRSVVNGNLCSLFPIRKIKHKPTLKKRNKGGISSLLTEWRKSRVAK
jgi:hypothetical protein